MGEGVALKRNLLTTTCSQTWLAQADLFQIRSNNSFCNVLGLIPECQDVQNPWLIECAKSLIIPKRNCDLRKATF